MVCVCVCVCVCVGMLWGASVMASGQELEGFLSSSIRAGTLKRGREGAAKVHRYASGYETVEDPASKSDPVTGPAEL